MWTWAALQDYYYQMVPESWYPDAHLNRTWLPAEYVPGSCWLCDRQCDLRWPGACIMLAFGAPLATHVACGDNRSLYNDCEETKLEKLAAAAVLWQAYPQCRAFELPTGLTTG
jgi:hypothetical protein